jgi:hypothetical protein
MPQCLPQVDDSRGVELMLQYPSGRHVLALDAASIRGIFPHHPTGEQCTCHNPPPCFSALPATRYFPCSGSCSKGEVGERPDTVDTHRRLS